MSMITITGMLFGALLLGPQGPTTINTPATGCQERCYQEKSQTYQRCRAISPSDRAARLRCFREADAALQRCLGGCK
jgi:hypothetical protein